MMFLVRGSYEERSDQYFSLKRSTIDLPRYNYNAMIEIRWEKGIILWLGKDRVTSPKKLN